MYQQLPELLPHRSLKHTATGYVPAGPPWSCLTSVVVSTATGYVPAGYLELPHGSLKHSNSMYQQATWSCPTRVAKHSNSYVPAGYPLSCPSHGSPSTATGYVSPAGCL
jgi:hypothetical protein